MRIAVAGGSGVVGRHVVTEAGRRGHEVVVLSRSSGVDLTRATDLPERLAGVDAVVDVSGTSAQGRKPAQAFFTTVTDRLLSAEQEVGCGHHVALSIIGVDRVPTGYYRGKVVQEERVEAGGVPWTILRAAQFHEFAEQALGFAAVGPLSLVPAMVTQPVAASEVAAALIGHVETGPAGRAPEIAGPEMLRLAELTRRVVRARRLRRRVVEVRLRGPAGRAMRAGALTSPTAGVRGRQTFAEWLASA